MNNQNPESILVITLAIGLIVISGLIMIFIADRTNTVTNIEQGAYASGTLLYTNNVSDGETVTINGNVFEYTTDGVVVPGNIAVLVAQQQDGSINETIAVLNMTEAIINDAGTSAFVSVQAR